MEISITVQTASELHLNQEGNPVQDAGTENISGCERRSSLTLFIPINLNIDEILRENPPNFNFQRDCFVYILHIISSIPTGKWKLLDSEGYTAVNKKLLQKRIHKYKSYLDYLISNEIIEESRHYIPGEKSGGIKFCSAYQSELKPVEITKHTLMKSICYKRSNVNDEKTAETHFLRKWFNSKLTVDVEGAKAFLSELKEREIAEGSASAQQAYNCRLLPLLEINAKEFSFAIDNTGYRLHTNLTRTMKDLRKHLKYDGQTLYSVDIVNSQPFLARPLFSQNYFNRNDIASKIINQRLLTTSNFPIMVVNILEEVKDQPDVKDYLKSVTKGNFYERFAELLIENGLFQGDVKDASVRDKVKEITFSVLYSPNTAIGHNPNIRVFAGIFPGVFKMIKKVKYGNQHNSYSILLQRLESELILDKVCKRINNAFPNIPIFTIHDSIVTTKEYVGIVQDFIKKVIRQNVGAAPVLKVEEWV